MKLNALIQKCKDTFPTLYQHREDVLDHLYCTIGNGYAWRPDGTIGSDGVVEENYPKCTLRQAVTEGVDQDGGQLIKMLHKRYVEKEGKKALSFAKFRKQYIDRRVAEEANRPKRDYFYPLYSDGPRYALVQNVPDNVQQDYLDGAFEVLECVEEDLDLTGCTSLTALPEGLCVIGNQHEGTSNTYVQRWSRGRHTCC